ncbi:hypothetical protein LNQ03_32715 [Klebsiella pneumoniae subsp. pneumoniae]|nr:hypothetical protein [Klebsiella pneumoniae subsp. pneumoniae]
MAKFIMAQYKDNLLGEANSFLEVLEQVSRLAPLDKTGAAGHRRARHRERAYC